MGYRGVGWDMTEQVRAQEQAVSARTAAERANESKSRFLAQIGHELRTPLNAILGFSEVIKDEILGSIGQPIYTDYGKHIHESGCYLLGLIDDLLDMSKLQAGKFELHEDTLVLPEMLMAVVHTIEPLAAKKELRFGVDIPVDLPHLRADDRAVRQVVINLLSNAVKFTPEAGKVMLKAHAADGRISLTVEDNGLGMEPGEIEKVLAPFSQLDNARRTAEKGTGLGLAIVEALMDLHGGTLKIESTPNLGTAATLMFPDARTIAE